MIEGRMTKTNQKRDKLNSDSDGISQVASVSL